MTDGTLDTIIVRRTIPSSVAALRALVSREARLAAQPTLAAHTATAALDEPAILFEGAGYVVHLIASTETSSDAATQALTTRMIESVLHALALDTASNATTHETSVTSSVTSLAPSP